MKNSKRRRALALVGAVAAATGIAAGVAPAAEASSSASYAASICGSGFWPDKAFSLGGGTVYVSYNGYTDCAVLIKTAYVGQPTDTWVYVGFGDGSGGGYGGSDGDGRDSGSFTTYAGPVYVDAPGSCIEVAGGTVLDERWWSPVLCG
jgi:hypothetical protein